MKVKGPHKESVSKSLTCIEEVAGEGLQEGKKNVIGSYRRKNPFYVGGIKCRNTVACRQGKIRSVSNELNELATKISSKNTKNATKIPLTACDKL